MNQPQLQSNQSVIDVFLTGSRKGFNLAIFNVVPNVMMAFILIRILNVTGTIDFLSAHCGPFMALFGLPGESVAVFLSAMMSMVGGAGAAATLYMDGNLTAEHVTILLPAILLMGAKVQYLGRLLGVADIQKRFYPILLGISFLNAMLAMLLMRVLLPFFHN